MWFLLQSSIIIAVYWTNIEYHWTPNGYVVGLIAYVLAYLATVLVTFLALLADRWSRKGPQRSLREEWESLRHVRD
jgi:hypothetical protein